MFQFFLNSIIILHKYQSKLKPIGKYHKKPLWVSRPVYNTVANQKCYIIFFKSPGKIKKGCKQMLTTQNNSIFTNHPKAFSVFAVRTSFTKSKGCASASSQDLAPRDHSRTASALGPTSGDDSNASQSLRGGISSPNCIQSRHRRWGACGCEHSPESPVYGLCSRKGAHHWASS
jgi:hypothetical protein